jgi:ATP-dependent RNA helicase RhlE
MSGDAGVYPLTSRDRPLFLRLKFSGNIVDAGFAGPSQRAVWRAVASGPGVYGARLRPERPHRVTQFQDLGLSAPILKALAAEGYTTPTPIQAQAIPLLMDGQDLIGLAQTGTGKTAAFALPILHRLNLQRRHAGPRACRVLVLAPTRELAAQIGDSFRAYGKFLGFSTAVVFGGASMFRQKEIMSRGVDVLVATPGRLIDHIGERSITLDKVEMLVLDEADHMLDIGFIHALKRIAKLVPTQRQTIFFSATMPAPIEELAAQFLNDAQRIAVTPVSSTAERVEQRVIHVDHAQKANVLADLLQDNAIARALVFTRTKHGADKVKSRLEEAGHRVEALHGNKSQGQRERALLAFRKGQARLLVATEIAARGIDVDEVTHVINFDLPNVPEQYVHRIGRTARAGQTGMAISFCAPDERVFLRDIERLTKQPVEVQANRLSLPTPQPGDRLPPALKVGGGGGQNRGPRPQRASGPRGYAAQGARSKPQGEYRGEPRGEYRGEPRGEYRGEARGEPRGDYRGEPRGEYRGEARGASGSGGYKSGPAKPRSAGPHGPASRGDGYRGDAPRSDGHRSEGHRSDGHRSEGPRKPRRDGDMWSNQGAPAKAPAPSQRQDRRGPPKGRRSGGKG